MTNLTNAEFLNIWFNEVWNEGRKDTIDRMLEENCLVTGLVPLEINSCDEFKQFQNQIFDTYTNFNVELLNFVSSGKDVAALINRKGIHKTTGKKVSFKSCFIAKIENGKISEAHNVVDFLSPLIQTGIIDQGVLEKF